MNYIVLDLEFNQPYNFKTGKCTALEPEMPFEIIQIGAVKMDGSFNITDKFNYFIKPQIYSRMHPIVEKLTGITAEKLKNSPNFTMAYEAFTAFMGSEETSLCTWGPDDIKALFRNIYYHKCDADAITKSYINIQTYATKRLDCESGNSIGLKNAVEMLNIPQEIQYHDALNDAYYTAKVFQLVHPKEVECQEFKLSDLISKKETATRVNTHELLEYFEKSLERELTAEEIAIIKTAYKFGKKGTFEMKATKNKCRN